MNTRRSIRPFAIKISCPRLRSPYADATPARALCCLVPLLLLALAVQAQLTSEQFGAYTVHYGAVASDALPDEVAQRHGLPANSEAVLLNVTVQQDGANVPARIEARAVNLAQQTRDIEMYETVANDLVSYLGVVEIAEREVLDFQVDVLPQGASEPLRIEFREEFLPNPLGAGAGETDEIVR
jgi:hypothetical protein